MLTNQEKIEFVVNSINNIDALIKSFINNSEICKDKYSLEEELLACNAKKIILLKVLNDLGGSI